MNKLFFILLFFPLFGHTQPTKDNFILKFEYIVINEDTTYFDNLTLPYHTDPIRDIEQINLISHKESELLYTYDFDINRKGIIKAFNLNFYKQVDDNNDRIAQLYYPIYFNKESKNNEIKKLKETQTTRFLVNNGYGESSIIDAILKFDFDW